jgi:hypothetical protein
MNLKQKLVIWIGLLVVAQIGVYPPWIQEFNDGELHLGPTASVHHWVFSPPGPPSWVWDRESARVKSSVLWNSRLDVARLLDEWATTVLVFAGIVWILREKAAPLTTKS